MTLHLSCFFFYRKVYFELCLWIFRSILNGLNKDPRGKKLSLTYSCEVNDQLSKDPWLRQKKKNCAVKKVGAFSFLQILLYVTATHKKKNIKSSLKDVWKYPPSILDDPFYKKEKCIYQITESSCILRQILFKYSLCELYSSVGTFLSYVKKLSCSKLHLHFKVLSGDEFELNVKLFSTCSFFKDWA